MANNLLPNLLENSLFKWLRLTISFPTRSIKVMWLLNELNIPIRDVSSLSSSALNNQDNALQVRFVRIENGEHLNPQLNPHPFLKVPCLEYQVKGEEQTHILFESNAILLFLLENFDTDKKLSPSTNINMVGQRFQLMMWTNSTFELEITPSMRMFKSLLQKKGLNVMNKHLLTMDNDEKEEYGRVSKMVRENYLPYIETLLASRDNSFTYWFGNEFDIVDICIGFCLKGSDTCNLLDENLYPECKKYYQSLCLRESHGKTMQQMMKMFTESLLRK